ncbi:MAG: hypothetical protein IAF58_08680 [Leptolyngbya sp.]|nr:hypothetical protein [Candidatus Melainabacteria bacterium]
MGGGLEYNKYELQPNADEENKTAKIDASEYQRSQYLPGTVEKPYGNGNTAGRATYGGDVANNFPVRETPKEPPANTGAWRARYGQDAGTAFKPGEQVVQAQNPNPNGGRATYGGDVGTTFQPGNGQTQQPGNGQWRKPYGADAPLVGVQPVERPVVPQQPVQGNGGEIDPLTGKPLPPRRQGNGADWNAPANVPGQQTPPGDGRAPQSNISQQRKIVDEALDYNTVGFNGNLVAGGIGGLLGRHTVPWAMDKFTGTVTLDPKVAPQGWRENVARYWQDNHNPNTWNRPELEFAKGKIDGAGGLASKMAEFSQPAQEALRVSSSRLSVLSDLTVATDAAAREALISRAATATDSISGKAIFSADELKLMDEFKTAGKMPDALKSLAETTAAENSHLAARAKSFAQLADQNIPINARSVDVPSRAAAAVDALDNHAARVNAGKPLFTPAEVAALKEYEVAAKSATLGAAELSAVGKAKEFAGKYGSSFLKGAGVAGSLMIVDHYADKMLFGKSHGHGVGDSLNSVLIPLALFAGPKKTVPMIATGVGALVVGKMVGSSLEEGENAKFSRYFRQGTTESIALAAEALVPMKGGGMLGANWKRAGLMAATWTAFRVQNAIFDSAPPSETKDKAWELLGDDAKKRTQGSMNDAIDKFASLGKGNESTGIFTFTNVFKEGQGKTVGARGEAALHVYRTEWLTKPTNQFGSLLEGQRGAAILTTAFAESRLAHGTHVPTIKDSPTYLLEGKNLDLGGKAARDFIIGRINAENAKKQVEQNLGKEIAGKKVEQSEIADLDSVKKRIEQSEAKIYGEHDMTGAVKELASWGQGLNAIHMGKIEVDLRNTIAANKDSTDTRYKAKLFRDLATIYVANAYSKQDGDPQSAAKLLGGDTNAGRQALDMTGQPRGYDGAFNCLQMARQLDPNNPDLAQLEAIAKSVNDKLPAGIQRQMNTGKHNPLQIRQ